MTMTSDGQCLLTSCQDEVIRLIDTDGGEILTEYKGHRGSNDYRIECDVLKGDGYIITGSDNGEAIIYDFLEANEVKRLKLGRNVVSSLCTHPTEDQILFASGREIQLWSLADHVISD